MRREVLYLADIVEAIGKASAYLEGVTREDFGDDEMRQDAVIRQLMVIGEAASAVSDDLRANSPAIPWRLIRGMRNTLVHEYFGVDLDIVYNVATRDAPDLAQAVLDQLFELDPDVAKRFVR